MDRKPVTNTKREPRVVVSRNGPYIVTGPVPLAKQIIVTAADGASESWQAGETIQMQEGYALCRCGQSKTKPICDGTHIKVGFDGTETASRETYLKQARMFDGPTVETKLPVSIGLIEDPEKQCSGPLWLRGGIPVISADGFEYEVRNRVTLCRCGQSANKPFCDGTHASVKFRDE